MSSFNLRRFLFVDHSIVVGSRILLGENSLSLSLIVRFEFVSLRLSPGVFFVISVESRIEQDSRTASYRSISASRREGETEELTSTNRQSRNRESSSFAR